MSIRFTLLATALGTAGLFAAAGHSEANPPPSSGGFSCFNKLDLQVVSCVGSIAVLPIAIDIKDIRVLDASGLNVLSNDLNHVSILDGGILNNDKILNDVELTVLQDLLNKLSIDVTRNDIDVCTSVLGLALCK